ncbi:4Fe-4S dicluster domain-containing protein [candidate division GN15 bacterium]|nr:4Fe-4S dicluster domain-containing protein [candidate division GN15 bacterium]
MSFTELQAQARRTWQSLQDSEIPVIYIGSATCGLAAGANKVFDTVKAVIEEHSLHARVVRVGCIGPCYLEPLMDIKIPNGPRISYASVNQERAREIIEGYFLNDDLSMQHAIGYLGEPGGVLANGLPKLFDLPMLKPQVRLVLRNCGYIDPEDIDHYLANDGYVGLQNVLERGYDWSINEVKEAGLRGRGGAGFPTHKKWEICRAQPGEHKYMVCNSSEGDPGAFMNRSLIESDPHAVLEGLLIAAYSIGADHGYIYINSDYELAIRRLKIAVQAMRDYGLLGENILGSDFSFDLTIKEGAGAFVCGEETALISAIEGKRGMPRSRPPFPAIAGVHAKPTIINNVETLGTLPNIMRHGAQWYRQFGVRGNYGTKTFSLVGKIRRGGLIEVPLGVPLRRIIKDIGGGSWKPFKAVQTGGPSGGCLSEEHLDIPVEYESMTKAGSIMGSGGLIVMDEETCAVDLALYFLRFTQKESCGKCVPCRVGTWQMVNILEEIIKGEGETSDIAKLQSLGETVKRASLCGLGQTAPNPVLTTLRYFRQEYLAHVKEHRCPSNVCQPLIIFDIDSEKCNGCHECVDVCPTAAISGSRSELHVIDQSRCIRCRACYEICRYNALAGDAVFIGPANSAAVGSAS